MRNNSNTKTTKFCPICEKPHKQKTQACTSCNKKLIELKPLLETNDKYKNKIRKAINLKEVDTY